MDIVAREDREEMLVESGGRLLRLKIQMYVEND